MFHKKINVIEDKEHVLFVKIGRNVLSDDVQLLEELGQLVCRPHILLLEVKVEHTIGEVVPGMQKVCYFHNEAGLSYP
jgi:hypothetical protein